MGKYVVTKRFTSRDGRLEVDDREYGMTEDGLAVIGDVAFHLGGATHIYAKTVGGPSNLLKFFTRDHGVPDVIVEEKPESGWANHNIEHGSGYNPTRGEDGWWNVTVEGAESKVAEGIGLPFSWHVSTFVEFTWREDGEGGDGGGDGGGDNGGDGGTTPITQIYAEIRVEDHTYAGWLSLQSQG